MRDEEDEVQPSEEDKEDAEIAMIPDLDQYVQLPTTPFPDVPITPYPEEEEE